MSILVAGRAGFIGSNCVLDWFRRQGETIINVDKLTYAVQPSPDGLAQAFSIGESFRKQGPSMVVLGDNIFYGHDFHHWLGRALQRSDGATVFADHVHDPERYGVVDFDTEGKVISLEEKPCRPSRAMPSPAGISTTRTS